MLTNVLIDGILTDLATGDTEETRLPYTFKEGAVGTVIVIGGGDIVYYVDTLRELLNRELGTYFTIWSGSLISPRIGVNRDQLILLVDEAILAQNS